MICATSDPNLLMLLFASHQQNRRLKKTLFAGDWEDERIHFTGRWTGWRGHSGVQKRRDIFLVFFMNACSSLLSLLCLLERNAVLQGKIQGNLGDFDAQNDVSV